ncbi:MAG: family 16 glycosylhydrolase [Dysgonomonas sp.]
MKKSYICLSLLFVANVFNLFADIDPYAADPNPPAEQEGYSLVWSDEFNIGAKPNTADWYYETGFVRNEEMQWYQSDNTSCANGLLQIEGRKETFNNPNYNSSSSDWRQNRQFVNYTSSSINTSQSHSWLFGRFEIRAKIPVFQGSWPAIWTLGIDREWPSCGEIDIMEYYANSILANAAWGTDRRWVAKWKSSQTPMSHFIAKDADWANKFHIWRMDWTEDYIKLYLDDELLNSIDLSVTINADGSNPFHQPHYLLLNLALGGINGGTIDDTKFPATYYVDYARVYQKNGASVSGVVPESQNIKQIGNILYFGNASENAFDVKIYQSTGEIILAKKVDRSNAQLNLSSLSNGVYFVQTKQNNTKQVSKIFINQ